MEWFLLIGLSCCLFIIGVALGKNPIAFTIMGLITGTAIFFLMFVFAVLGGVQ